MGSGERGDDLTYLFLKVKLAVSPIQIFAGHLLHFRS